LQLQILRLFVQLQPNLLPHAPANIPASEFYETLLKKGIDRPQDTKFFK
jgi:hypothetical protein